VVSTALKKTEVMYMDDPYIVSFECHLEKEKGRQPSTVKAYLKAVRAFQGWLGQTGLAACSVEAADITSYLEARKAKPSYRNFILGALRVWYDYLGEIGQVDHNPARELERSVSRAKLEGKDELSTEEAQQLREAVVHHSRPFERARNRAIVSLLLDAGLSTQELCGLKDADIDDQGERVAVLLRGVKSKERSVVLEGEAQQALQEWLDERAAIARYVDGLHQQLTFWEVIEVTEVIVPPVKRPPKAFLWSIPANRKKGWPLTDQGLRFMLKHFAKLAEIEKNVTPRLLRKTFAR
jgi:site-specific recombinase XerD